MTLCPVLLAQLYLVNGDRGSAKSDCSSLSEVYTKGGETSQVSLTQKTSNQRPNAHLKIHFQRHNCRQIRSQLSLVKD